MNPELERLNENMRQHRVSWRELIAAMRRGYLPTPRTLTLRRNVAIDLRAALLAYRNGGARQDRYASGMVYMLRRMGQLAALEGFRLDDAQSLIGEGFVNPRESV